MFRRFHRSVIKKCSSFPTYCHIHLRCCTYIYIIVYIWNTWFTSLMIIQYLSFILITSKVQYILLKRFVLPCVTEARAYCDALASVRNLNFWDMQNCCFVAVDSFTLLCKGIIAYLSFSALYVFWQLWECKVYSSSILKRVVRDLELYCSVFCIEVCGWYLQHGEY